MPFIAKQTLFADFTNSACSLDPQPARAKAEKTIGRAGAPKHGPDIGLELE
jgi:hypothetical protein